MSKKYNIGWQPLPGTSQVIALSADCDEILYTGSRGPGKTDTQLMRFRGQVNKGYGRFWRGVIFDKEYKNLDDLVSKSKHWFRTLDRKTAQFKESKGDYKWIWATGEELLFRVAKDPEDYWDYHGQEFPFIGWNELCKWPKPDLYDAMLSCNRSSFTPEKDTPTIALRDEEGNYVHDRSRGLLCKPIPLECFSTTNSYGPGHSWVKRRFILPAPRGVVVKVEREVFSPAKQTKVKVTRSQIAIFGSYRENIYLDAKYVANLESERNKERRKAWLAGSWDIVAGGAFDDLWDIDVHVVPRFVVPKEWHIDRAFDWGSSAPFAVLWFAEANGEDVILPNGSKWCPNAGSLVQIYEWYGTESVGSNAGLRLSPSNIAKGIVKLEKMLIEKGWINQKPFAGPADNQISQTTRPDVETIARAMEAEGISWQPSDKSSGSRKVGMDLFRDRLERSLTGEGPGAYIMANNSSTLEIIPTLPRDPDNQDDVDTNAEDHIWDVWRYRVLKGNNRLVRPENIRVTFAN